MATLKQLQTFIAVAEYKKMSEAAKKLYVSQPTVSQTIADLENEYGVPLFQRHPKELKITFAGQHFLTSAQEIIAIHNNLEQTMKNIHSKRPLRIGATLTVGNTILAALVKRLTTKYPDIDVTVYVDNTHIIEHRIIHNELDITLVEGTIVREEIITEPVIEDSLCIFCSPEHPLAAKKSISFEDLRGVDFIMREQGSGTRALFENIMKTHHISFQSKWECNSGTAIIEAVRNNMGLGVLSSRCIQAYADTNAIHICPLEDVSIKRYFYLCYNRNHPITSQMKHFMEIANQWKTL